MTLKEAKSILVKYNNNGYPTIGEFQKISDEEFNKWVNIWPPEYLEAMIMFGESLGYKEDSGLKRAGFFPVLTVWGERVQKAREVIAYKKTTEGKQDVLKTIAPTMTSMEQRSAARMKRMKELKTLSEKAAVEKKISKQQAKLNAKRIELIEAIEHYISKDGKKGNDYENVLKEYHKSVNNLPTNEDAAQWVMEDKKINKILSLILSWFTMPLFVILRVLGFIFDSAIMVCHMAGSFMSQLGGKHSALSRIEIPLIITIFYVTVTEYTVGGDFRELFVRLSERTEIGFNETIVAFLMVLFFVTVIRNIGGIVPFFAANIYGSTVVEKASRKFSTASENDYQMRAASEKLDTLNFIKKQIDFHEEIVEALIEAVETNSPYCKIDELCDSRKDLSTKYLYGRDKYIVK